MDDGPGQTAGNEISLRCVGPIGKGLVNHLQTHLATDPGHQLPLSAGQGHVHQVRIDTDNGFGYGPGNHLVVHGGEIERPMGLDMP